MARIATGALVCLILLWLTPAQAIDKIHIQSDNWLYQGFAARQFELGVSLTASGLQLDATARQLDLPAPWGQLEQVHLHCDELRLAAATWQCDKGQLQFTHPRLGPQQLGFAGQANADRQQYQLELTGLKLAQGQMQLKADYQAEAWTVDLTARDTVLAALNQWLPLFLSESQRALLAEWDYQGKVSLNANVSGRASQLAELTLDWQLDALSFSNQSATQIAEDLSVTGQLDARMKQNQWQWQANLKSDSGQAYSEPIFLDLMQHPVSLSGKGEISADFDALRVVELQFDQQSVLSGNLSLNWQQGGLTDFKLASEAIDLSKLYPVWLQPFALGTAAAKMQLEGQAAVNIDWQQGDYQLQLAVDELSLKDETEKFSLQNLNGKLAWTNTDNAMSSKLNWSRAKLYALDLGAAGIAAESRNNGLTLTEGLDLPVLDGSLQVNAFELQRKADGHVDWQFDGLLKPISMESLSAALEWPPLHGKLSGIIPRVSYSGQQLTIDGALQMKIFDGTTVIRDLRLTSPLGRLPQLYANIDISDLDLGLLTRTFDFGLISGRLEGYVHGLRLSNWRPVQFDARLQTPEDNPGKRRISQRAVDNLTEIGGGASGMLSRSFLGFFEDFSYQKLGLACRLQNEMCLMSGVGEAEQGYYIVKGGGGLPPWINVIGYTQRVDWADLIARLLAVRDSSGPVIE
jgi:hypothetical protein